MVPTSFDAATANNSITSLELTTAFDGRRSCTGSTDLEGNRRTRLATGSGRAAIQMIRMVAVDAEGHHGHHLQQEGERLHATCAIVLGITHSPACDILCLDQLPGIREPTLKMQSPCFPHHQPLAALH